MQSVCPDPGLTLVLDDPQVTSLDHTIRCGGEAGARVRSFDWSSTSLGPVERWSNALRITLNYLLNSPESMYLLWGADLIFFHNDAYAPILGPQLAGAIGQTIAQLWPEAWPQLEPMARKALAGESSRFEDMPCSMARRSKPEDTGRTFSFAPAFDDDGTIGGVVCVTNETAERVHTSDALRASDARYRALFSSIDAGFCIIEVIFDGEKAVDYRFLETNPAFDKHAGLANAVGRTMRDFASDHEEHWFAMYGRVARTGEPVRFEQPAMALGGKLFDGYAYRVEEGRVAVLFNDVTERDRADRALRDLNADLEHRVTERALARGRTWQISPEIMGVLNADGYFEASNPAWQKLLGWSEAEIASTVFFDFIHSDDLPKTHAAWADAMGRGLPALQFENRYRRKDGGWRWLSWVAIPDDGKVYCSARDITEEKAQAAALLERTAERDLLAQVVETTDTLVMVSDLDYNILAINKANADAFEQIYGVRPKVGDNMLALLAGQPEHQAAVRKGWGRALAGEEATYVEEYGDPERARPYFEVKFRNLLNEKGERIGAYQFVTDVTARLRQEAELATAQDALRQSQKLEAIGQLTGGVAHDFNNLLTVIRGSIDLMRRGTLPEERRQRHMQAISDTVTRATRLTQQLLAFARRQTLQPEAIDVGKNMRAVSEMLATLTGSRIEIIPYAPPEPCFINVDPSQFDTALVNMAVNARDAMEGEGTLTIRVKPISLMPAIRNHPSVEGSFVAVSLTDTGAGIPENKLDQIFEPFFTTKAAGAGTGLGLSQVFGFAKQSGGEVMVESEVGKGTTFTLYLPRVEAPAEIKEPIAEEEAIDGNGACVLLVEDNEEVGSFASQALIDLGYIAVWAFNATQALAELDKDAGRFDVVFSDVIMPGMNGVDLAQEIRRRQPDLPVVLTSGYSSVLAQGGTHGFELLHKPYSVEQMSRVLGKAAAKRK